MSPTATNAPTLIASDALLLDGRLVAGWVRLEAGRIAEVGTGGPPDRPDLRLDGGALAPGLVDLQVNGAAGVDLAGSPPADWARAGTWLARGGVTAYVPTFISDTVEALCAALQRADAGWDDALSDSAAVPLGVHLEGPFLAAERPGTHPLAVLRDPDPDAIDALVAAGAGRLRYVTLAPERPGGLDAVRRLRAAGVLVAIGHSDADEAGTAAAVEAGATLVTHLYNAQRPLHHRDGGVVGVALTDARLTLGLIADSHHVGATAIRLAFAQAAGRIALVTDLVAAAGMPPGRHPLGAIETVTSAEGPARRADGTLAGATSTLAAGVANVVALGVDPAVALAAASTVPAAVLGDEERGRVAVGRRADLVWFDAEWRVRRVWLGGHAIEGVGDAGASDAGEGRA
jgi:N-acetylglucosamine-6-phosphate deacetylase